MMSRNMVFTLILSILAVAFVYRITPPSAVPHFRLTVEKNTRPIHHLSNPRNVKHRKEHYIDVVDLSERNQFSHPRLGRLGFNDNFFADIQGYFIVTDNVDITFSVESDDGFSLSIDGEIICESPGPRAFKPTRCHQSMDAGRHEFILRYYQGYGYAGLRMKYKLDRGWHLWGEGTDAIQFVNYD